MQASSLHHGWNWEGRVLQNVMLIVNWFSENIGYSNTLVARGILHLDTGLNGLVTQSLYKHIHMYLLMHECVCACLDRVRVTRRIAWRVARVTCRGFCQQTQIVYFIFLRYAIGNAERIMLTKNIGWLHTLGNDIDEPYFENKTGGPSIKVNCGDLLHACDT